MIDAAYNDALGAVAEGATREETSAALAQRYPLTPDEINDVMVDAYRDALRQGVEPEDIDGSWRVR